jgi:hypothetical protein
VSAEALEREAPPGPARETPTPIGEVVRWCAVVFVAVRVLTLVAAFVASSAFPTLRAQGVPGWPAPPLHPGWTDAFSLLERFDALWFLRIADTGYRAGDNSAAFFPLFPLATRSVAAVFGGRPLAAAIVVSNGVFLAALVLVHRATERELGARAARVTVLLLSLFPTSYFFLLPYSESLFLALAAASLLAARRGRWAIAGTCAALAALTRSVGIVLLAALAVEALHRRSERGEPLAPGLVAAAAPVAGLAAYAAWWQVRAGDWLIPLTRQQSWERRFSWPWATLADGARLAFRTWGAPSGGYWAFDLAIVVPVLALGVVAATTIRPSYAVYVWGGLLAPLSFAFAGRPLMSMPRFVAVLFPVLWPLARLLEPRAWLRWATLTASAIAMVVLCSLATNWFYVF